jgi:hypothetical protein
MAITATVFTYITHFVVNSGFSITQGAKWFLVGVYLSTCILSLLRTFLLRWKWLLYLITLYRHYRKWI